MDVGKRIAALRKKLNLSQYKLAKRSGVSQGAISHYEMGNKIPGVDVIEKLCNAMKVSLADFFADELQLDEVVVESVIYDDSVVPENLTPEEKGKLDLAVRVVSALIEEERKKKK